MHNFHQSTLPGTVTQKDIALKGIVDYVGDSRKKAVQDLLLEYDGPLVAPQNAVREVLFGIEHCFGLLTHISAGENGYMLMFDEQIIEQIITTRAPFQLMYQDGNVKVVYGIYVGTKLRGHGLTGPEFQAMTPKDQCVLVTNICSKDIGSPQYKELFRETFYNLLSSKKPMPCIVLKCIQPPNNMRAGVRSALAAIPFSNTQESQATPLLAKKNMQPIHQEIHQGNSIAAARNYTMGSSTQSTIALQAQAPAGHTQTVPSGHHGVEGHPSSVSVPSAFYSDANTNIWGMIGNVNHLAQPNAEPLQNQYAHSQSVPQRSQNAHPAGKATGFASQHYQNIGSYYQVPVQSAMHQDPSGWYIPQLVNHTGAHDLNSDILRVNANHTPHANVMNTNNQRNGQRSHPVPNTDYTRSTRGNGCRKP
ncbi:hypothetical protein BDQ12DRAFT_335245 [Crucibulum laeve]|uniref:Uncharacterized protein n=1 Tax=Crucibulum laeve TaxID=68775 RepID=A0A5C3LQQ4_9AGAR|nr:hypothetical protein BDQ12DRAFT_335245 [Crucibulum laeve]